MKHLKYILLIWITLSATIVSAQQIKMVLSGNPSFSSSSLSVTEAGNNLTSTLTSSTKTYMQIYGTGRWDWIGYTYWQVTLHKSDVNWNNSLSLEVKRSGNGTMDSWTGSLTGGTNYQAVTNTPVYFFNGQGSWSSIPVDYRIGNISVTIPAGNYSTTLYFTVYEQ